MSEFRDQYIDRLITQYEHQPNARAEIDFIASLGERVFQFLEELSIAHSLDADIYDAYDAEFDDEELWELDNGDTLEFQDGARGALLDVLGKILGLQRKPGQSDGRYLFLLNVAAVRNNASAYIVHDDLTTLQDAIQTAFPDGRAWVVDTLDMLILYYIESGATIEEVREVVEGDLLPSPQGVGYDLIFSEDGDTKFGFAELNQSTPTDVDGFGELNASPLEGGKLSELFAR